MSHDLHFLIERMDEVRCELKKDIETQGAKLSKKIDALVGFKNRVIGMAIVVSVIVGSIGSVVMHFMLKGL